MQLDDVVHSSVTGPRLEEATHRFLVASDYILVIFLVLISYMASIRAYLQGVSCLMIVFNITAIHCND